MKKEAWLLMLKTANITSCLRRFVPVLGNMNCMYAYINAESEASFARKNKDQITAEEMRCRSMKTLSETAKRKPDGEKNQTTTLDKEKIKL